MGAWKNHLTEMVILSTYNIPKSIMLHVHNFQNSTSSLENSVAPDQLTSNEASWSGSTLFHLHDESEYGINWVTPQEYVMHLNEITKIISFMSRTLWVQVIVVSHTNPVWITSHLQTKDTGTHLTLEHRQNRKFHSSIIFTHLKIQNITPMIFVHKYSF